MNSTIATGGSCACAIALALGTGVPAQADILANWTFETSVPTTAGPHAAEAGLNAATSFASGFHASMSVVYSNPVGNGSLESFSSNFWAVDDYYQFSTSTTGFESITIEWHQTRSSTGPSTFDLEWSTDGSSFTTLLDDYSVPADSWSSVGMPLVTSMFGPAAGPAALDNQATIYFRLVADAAAGGTAGSSRVDNIVISGSVIPAPPAIALLALAPIMIGPRRRRPEPATVPVRFHRAPRCRSCPSAG
jgi:hypothetical protein